MLSKLLAGPQNQNARRILSGLFIASMLITSALTFTITRSLLSREPETVVPLDEAAASRPMPDFTLTSHLGEPVSLRDFRGELTVLFFGYTRCPDVCPSTLADFRQAKNALGAAGDEVNFVFISVDGERDSPIAVREYLRHFDEDFVGLTGDPQLVRDIGRDYNVQFVYTEETDAYGRYLVDHTTPSFVLDRAGRVRSLFRFGTSPDQMAAELEALLNSQGDVQFLLDEPRPVDDFTLTSHLGEALSLSDLLQRPTVLFFGYTNCPDICPTTLAEFAQVRRAMGVRAEDVNFVFISVDGARDTPAVIDSYIHGFDDAFIGLTGDPQLVRQIGEPYNLFVEIQNLPVHNHADGTAHTHSAEDGYLVDHTSSSFLIDTDGRLAGVFPFATLPEDIAATLETVLAR